MRQAGADHDLHARALLRDVQSLPQGSSVRTDLRALLPAAERVLDPAPAARVALPANQPQVCGVPARLRLQVIPSGAQRTRPYPLR